MLRELQTGDVATASAAARRTGQSSSRSQCACFGEQTATGSAPGSFVDLTADLAWLTARPLSDFVLDQHLPATAERGAATSLFTAWVINQAIGALIGQGFTPERAERHLTAEGADAGISRHAVGLCILSRLTAR